MSEVVEMPVGSAVRKIIRERTREAEDWKRLDAYFSAVGNVDAVLANKRNEVARLEGEEASIRSRVSVARGEAGQLHADALADAEQIRAKAQAVADDAERKRDEAVELVDQAKAEARKIVADARNEVASVMARIKNM